MHSNTALDSTETNLVKIISDLYHAKISDQFSVLIWPGLAEFSPSTSPPINLIYFSTQFPGCHLLSVTVFPGFPFLLISSQQFLLLILLTSLLILVPDNTILSSCSVSKSCNHSWLSPFTPNLHQNPPENTAVLPSKYMQKPNTSHPLIATILAWVTIISHMDYYYNSLLPISLFLPFCPSLSLIRLSDLLKIQIICHISAQNLPMPSHFNLRQDPYQDSWGTRDLLAPTTLPVHITL